MGGIYSNKTPLIRKERLSRQLDGEKAPEFTHVHKLHVDWPQTTIEYRHTLPCLKTEKRT